MDLIGLLILEGELKFNITGSKTTCGVSSVASGDYHGWLRNGELVEV